MPMFFLSPKFFLKKSSVQKNKKSKLYDGPKLLLASFGGDSLGYFDSLTSY
jgi:hypothetical protein